RVNSGVRTSVSRARMCLLSAGWVRCSRAAARVKCCSSATATKQRSARRCGSMPMGYHNGNWTARRSSTGLSSRAGHPPVGRDVTMLLDKLRVNQLSPQGWAWYQQYLSVLDAYDVAGYASFLAA